MTRANTEKLLGGAFFVAFIAADQIFGITAGVRVMGVACLVAGMFWVVGRSVPIGIEGRPPFFYLRGTGALVAGLAMLAIGVALLMYSGQTACVLGWSTSVQCK